MIQNDVGTVVPERLTPFLYPQNLGNDDKMTKNGSKLPNHYINDQNVTF